MKKAIIFIWLLLSLFGGKALAFDSIEIKKDDCIWTLAEKLEVSFDEMKKINVNNLRHKGNYDLIYPTDKLLIPDGYSLLNLPGRKIIKDEMKSDSAERTMPSASVGKKEKSQSSVNKKFETLKEEVAVSNVEVAKEKAIVTNAEDEKGKAEVADEKVAKNDNQLDKSTIDWLGDTFREWAAPVTDSPIKTIIFIGLFALIITGIVITVINCIEYLIDSWRSNKRKRRMAIICKLKFDGCLCITTWDGQHCYAVRDKSEKESYKEVADFLATRVTFNNVLEVIMELSFDATSFQSTRVRSCFTTLTNSEKLYFVGLVFIKFSKKIAIALTKRDLAYEKNIKG